MQTKRRGQTREKTFELPGGKILGPSRRKEDFPVSLGKTDLKIKGGNKMEVIVDKKRRGKMVSV